MHAVELSVLNSMYKRYELRIENFVEPLFGRNKVRV